MSREAMKQEAQRRIANDFAEYMDEVYEVEDDPDAMTIQERLADFYLYMNQLLTVK